MTVTYSSEIATSKNISLLKLLFLKWRGSVARLIWRDLVVFLIIHYALHFMYLYLLGASAKKVFEEIVQKAKTLENIEKIIPLPFLLGFFISSVFTRWWDQFRCIQTPTTLAVIVSSNLQGYDEEGRAMRRTIMRYVCLSITMVFRVLSPRVQRRFPLMSDLIEAGLINENELAIIDDLNNKFPGKMMMIIIIFFLK
jgi:bestrophin, other